MSTKVSEWANQVNGILLPLQRLNIGPRLTVCFAFIVLAMLLGNVALLWQFHRARGQAELLSGVDQELIAVLQAHANVMSFYERLDVLARSQNTIALMQETKSLGGIVHENTLRTRNALTHLPPQVRLDRALVPTLIAIQDAQPAQIEAITTLAKAGEWDAIRLRVDKQVRALENRSAALVESIDRDVDEERAHAVSNIERIRSQILVTIPLTAALTLLIAAFLGLAITRSITHPLRRLMQGSTALANGDFSQRVPAAGKDEIAHLGNTFNNMTARLQELYRHLQTREAYLAQAQKLSHTGSFGWDVLSGEMYWSAETFRIFEFEPNEKITIDLILQRAHPEDRDRVQRLIERATGEAKDWDLEHRIVMPDGAVKHLYVVAHAKQGELTGAIKYVGAVMDVTTAKESRQALERAYAEIQELKDQLQKENIVLREEIDSSSMFEEIVGDSAPLRSLLSGLSKVAPTNSTVLITGETGTGKELVARAIHKLSPRSAHAFVAVNCAAIPPSLIASELFGHEKGAFTGAIQRRQGRFELADGGTIFLDEVGDLPPDIQIALLRILQEREFERVGSNRTIRVDVRVIAATNRNIETLVGGGSFRADLFYRLNVFPLEVPPLRERRTDIPLLVEYFAHRFAKRAGKKIRGINKKTLSLLKSYAWPGNIRELQNVVERAVIVCDSDRLSIEEEWLSGPWSRPRVTSTPRPRTLAVREKEAIEAALMECKGRVAGPFGAAVRLGVPSSTLESKIKVLNIDKGRFKL